jgi:uncharacterized membrane protein YcaP (DUF421 family)
MDTVIRGIVVYLFLLLVLRLSGKRSLASISVFDFVLVLILSETVQQALIDNDNSMTNAALLVVTLIGFDVLLSHVKGKFPQIEKIIDSSPVLVIREGEILRDRMARERVDDADILASAREHEAISRLNEIDYAIVEQNGNITVIPKRNGKQRDRTP